MSSAHLTLGNINLNRARLEERGQSRVREMFTHPGHSNVITIAKSQEKCKIH